jgi:beta-N-acetylhexosaminidase
MTLKALPLMRGPVMVDLQSTTLTEHERERLRHPLVGAVILFARNFKSKRQLKALCDEIHAIRTPSLLIAVDHEGGRVQRFRDGFSAIPPMRTLGDMWDKDPLEACRKASELGECIASELVDCGVDLSFTPVLDLDHGHSKVIGNRSFHHDPRVVTMLARALIGGLHAQGMSHCAKHFPGHGWASADSHLALPIDDRPLDQILAVDAMPYQSLGRLLRSVMPAHIVYSSVDTKPAGFSKTWIKHILRKDLGFDGFVFSDDLTMEAASVAGSIKDRANAALAAGCDMVLVCNRPDLADELLAQLTWKSSKTYQRRLQALMPLRS